MGVIGTIVWLVALLWAVLQGFLMRQKVRSEQATEHTSEVHALLLAVSVIVVPAFSLSPLHLLWMVPTSFLLGLSSVVFPLNLLWLPASLYGALWYVGIRSPALALYRAGEYTSAIAAFNEAIRQKPQSPDNHFYLALAYDKVGDHRNAIASLRECVRLRPDFAEAHCNLGFSLKDTGDLQSAADSFSQAIRLKPDYAKAISNLGLVYVALGDLTNARKQCNILEAVNRAQATELREAITAAE